MQAQITALTTRISSAPQPSLTVPPAPLPVSAPAPLPPLSPARPPAPAYSSVARRAQEQPQTPTGPIRKISYVTDSIGGNVMLPELEQLTKAKISTRKAYGAVRAPDHFYPDANFTDIVPKEMEKNKPDALIIQMESITLTNLSSDSHKEFAKQEVKVAASNMFTVATSALAANPTLQKVVLMQAVPRFDTMAKEELNKYGNLMLHHAKQESDSVHKHKIYIGFHTLDCQTKGVKASRYGDARHQPDMIHMRGPSGQAAYTRSVASILAGAGLASPQEAAMVARPGLSDRPVQMKKTSGKFQTQGRRGRPGPSGQHRPNTFEVATHNMFAELQDFC